MNSDFHISPLREKYASMVLGACLLFSLFVHVTIAGILPKISVDDMTVPVRSMSIQMVSLAAPMIQPQEIEPAAGGAKQPDIKIVSQPKAKKIIAEKPAEPVKSKPIKKKPVVKKHKAKEAPLPLPKRETSNNTGTEKTTVIPVLKDVSVTSQTPPIYPSKARRMGQQGTVLLHALINQDGATQDLKIVSSSGYKSLDNSALKAVKGWKFASATRDGRPMKAWVEVPVRFVLK